MLLSAQDIDQFRYYPYDYPRLGLYVALLSLVFLYGLLTVVVDRKRIRTKMCTDCCWPDHVLTMR